jgi:hypothetical protein
MLSLYDIQGAAGVSEQFDWLRSSEGVRMVNQTVVGHSVTAVQCAGNLVAAAGAGGITVSRAVARDDSV